MHLEIPDDVIPRHMTPEQLRVEVAVYLFREEELTLGQAARVAGMCAPDFQHLLGRRKIPLHYGVNELRQDVRTLEELDRTT